MGKKGVRALLAWGFAAAWLLPSPARAGTIAISNTQAFEIARTAAKNLGIEPSFVNMEIRHYRVHWNLIFPKDSTSPLIRDHQKKLKGKAYWAVLFFPVEEREGSPASSRNICVFVDSDNGRILTVYQSG